MKRLRMFLMCCAMVMASGVNAQTTIDSIIKLDGEMAALERMNKIEETRKKLKSAGMGSIDAPSSGALAEIGLPATAAAEDRIALLSIVGYQSDLMAEVEINGALLSVRQGTQLGTWLVEKIVTDAVVLRKGARKRSLMFSLRASASVDATDRNRATARSSVND